MAKHLETGARGEDVAVQYLIGKGYVILHKNWRYRHLEVDIVGMDDETLVFVEVKARRSNAFGLPHEFVDWQKQKNLIAAAEAYLETNSYIGEIRFDIVSINSSTMHVELIKDAFWSN